MELLLEKKQLQKSKEVGSSLERGNQELKSHNSSFQAEVLEAREEATATLEEASEAQGVGVQARFRILRQLLFQLEPSFDIRAFKAFVTAELIQNVVAKAMAEATGERGGASEEPTLEEAVVPKVAEGKEAVVEKDATPEVAVGKDLAPSEATPKVTPEAVLEEASGGAKAAEATIGDRAD